MNFLRKLFPPSFKERMVAIYKIASPRYGLCKRIDENRELLQYLYEHCPGVLQAHPWIKGWIKGNDEFFCELHAILFAGEAGIFGPVPLEFASSATQSRWRPRAWPEMQKQRQPAGGSANAYPLKKITICAQGTRHSSTESIIQKLEEALERLKDGDQEGWEHDDDFGYRFKSEESANGPSFFVEPYGRK